MTALRTAAEPLVRDGPLHPDLVLDDGALLVQEGGVYRAAALRANPHLSRERLGAGGHENLVNQFHLNDFVDPARPDWAVWCVAQGVLLGREVLRRLARLTDVPVDVLVTVDPGTALGLPEDPDAMSVPGSTFRFLTHREGDPWTITEVSSGQAQLWMRRA